MGTGGHPRKMVYEAAMAFWGIARLESDADLGIFLFKPSLDDFVYAICTGYLMEMREMMIDDVRDKVANMYESDQERDI